MESLNKYIYSRDFHEFYHSVLKTELTSLDSRISKMNRHIPNWFLYLGLVPVLVTILIAIISTNSDNLGLYDFTVLLFVCWGIYVSTLFYFLNPSRIADKEKAVKKYYKDKIIKPVLNNAYSKAEYIPHQRFGSKSIQNSLLFPVNLGPLKGEDFFRFYIDDIMIQFSEIYVSWIDYEEPERSVFLSADFHKSFKTTCVVKKEATGFNKTYKPISRNSFNKTLDLIKLEESEFEKRFMVYGEDQVESRFLLSTSIMDRIVAYQNKLDCSMEFSFVDNRLYVIFMNTGDLFEPNFNRKNEDIDNLKDKIGLIGNIADIVYDLNLNTQIWNPKQH